MVYVRAKSKKEINEMLARGEDVYGTDYEMFNTTSKRLRDLPKGNVIKVFEKYVGGNPYAKSYGTWSARRGKVL